MGLVEPKGCYKCMFLMDIYGDPMVALGEFWKY